MKLIFCPQCEDVRKLHKGETVCLCGASFGKVLDDGLNAKIGGAAVPLGFSNKTFAMALRDRPKGSGPGSPFGAFVIPEVCDTVSK